MIISERQAGVAKKGEGEVRLAPNAREASMRRLSQGREVGTADVGQFPALDVAPHLFDGVQLRRVPRQGFDREPGTLVAQVGPHRAALVGAQPVPEEPHAPAPKVPLELPHEGDQRHVSVAPWARLEIESRPPRVPAKRQRPGDRQALPGGPRVGQDGGLPARGPGAPADGLLRDAALVLEDEPGALAAGVFLPWASGAGPTAESPLRPARARAAPAAAATTVAHARGTRRGRDDSGPRAVG